MARVRPVRNSKTTEIMRTFAGCAVGEARMGLLAHFPPTAEESAYQMLVGVDYLKVVLVEPLMGSSRYWYALTDKGKAYVQRFEQV